MVILVKPQFEVGAGRWARAELCATRQLHQAAVRAGARSCRGLGFVTDIMESPILGAEGNREFLLYASRD